MAKSEPKIIQLCPVQNVWAGYEHDGMIELNPIKLVALFDDGLMEYVDDDSTGYLDIVSRTVNFCGVKHQAWAPDPVPVKKVENNP